MPRIVENIMMGKTVKIAYVKTLPHDANANLRPILIHGSNETELLEVKIGNRLTVTRKIFIAF